MNRIYFCIMSLLLSSVIWTSCTTDGDVDFDGGLDAGQSSVSFQAKIGPMSRATDTRFDIGDEISVYAVLAQSGDNKGYLESSGNYADNIRYTYNGTKFTSTEGIVPQSGEKYFYHAVYPYSIIASDFFLFSVKEDQRGVNYTKSDLCTAHTAATSATSVQLNFGHRLSKIIVNLEGSNWPSGDQVLTLQSPKINAFVDLNEMTFEAAPSIGKVICAENGLNSFKVILPPQTISKSNFAVLTIGGRDYPVNLSNDVLLQSGIQKELTLTFDDANNSVVEFGGTIGPWEEEDPRLDDVVPEEIQDKISKHIPIYNGVNPPNIEGTYLVEPFVTVFCEDENGYEPGELIVPSYIRFSNQNTVLNTLDFEEKTSLSEKLGTGAFICGSGANFTAFFNTEGYSEGVYNRTALVISGTKTSLGIEDLYYAFVMVEKGEDPDNNLMQEGYFRVFKDEDGLSVPTSWPSVLAPSRSINPLKTAWSAR